MIFELYASENESYSPPSKNLANVRTVVISKPLTFIFGFELIQILKVTIY